MNRRGTVRRVSLSKVPTRKQLMRRLLAASLPTLLANVVYADSQTWIGATTSWNDPANWSGAATPGNTGAVANADVATFGATGVGTVDLGGLTWTLGTTSLTNPTGGYTFSNGTLDVDAITLGNASGANIFNALLTDQLNDGLVISSSIAQPTATLTLSGATVTSSAAATVGTTGTLLNRAAFTMYGGAGVIAGVTTTGTYSIAGGVYFNNVNTTSLGGAWTVGGNFLIENGGTTTYVSGGSYAITGDLQNTGSVLNLSTGTTTSVGGNLIAGAVVSGTGTNGTPIINIGQALTGLGGTLQLAGGTVNMNVSNPFFDTTKVLQIAPSTAASQNTTLALATTLTLDNPLNVGTGAGTTTITGASGSIYNGTIALGKSINLNSSGGVTAYNGIISGAGASIGINNGTTGTVQLATGNTFGGIGSTVTLNGGLARIAANSGFGDANNALNLNGGGIQLNGAAIDITNVGRTLTFNAGKTFTFDTNSVATTTFANAFGGGTSAAFTKTGVGILVLGAAETYSGLTTLSGGTLQSAVTTNAFGTGTSIGLAGGTLALRSNSSATFGSTGAPSGYTLAMTASSTVDVNNNGSGSGQTLTLGAGTIGANTLSVTGGNSYTLSTGALTQSVAGTTIFSPTTAVLSLGGFTSFTSGASTLSFRQTGTTIVNGALVNGGGTLNMDRSNQTGTTIIAVASPAFGTGTVAVTQGVLQTAIMTNAFGNAAINMGGGTLSLKSDSNATFGQNVGTPGAYNITTTATTSISSTPVTSAAAGTAITLGNLSLGSSGAGQVMNTLGTVGLTFGAVTNGYTGGATNNGFANAITPATGTLTLASVNYTALGADGKFTISGVGKTTIAGGIASTGAGVLSVTYSGTNTLSINGASSYAGPTSIGSSSGVLSVGNDLALGTGNLVNNGATLLVSGTRSLANPYQSTGTTTITGGDLTLTGGVLNNSTGASVLTINNNTTFSTSNVNIRGDAGNGQRTMTIGGSGNAVINTPITNGLTGSLNDGTALSIFIYNGTGSLTLNGANTYQGPTTFSQGTILIGTNAPIGSAIVGVSGAFGNAAATSVVALGSGTLTGNVSVLTTGAYTIDRTLAETVSNATQNFFIGGKQTSGTSSYTGGIGFAKDSTIVSGTGGQVNFTGAWNTTNKNVTVGAVIGATPYAGNVRLATSVMSTTGSVNVAFGKLIVDSGIAGGGTTTLGTAVTVASGATLAGAGGTITKAISISNGGHLSPGSATNFGILNVTGTEITTPVTPGTGTLNFGATGNYDINLTGTGTVAGTTFDQINLIGTADLGGAALNVTGSSLTLSDNEIFTIIANDGSDAVLNTFSYSQDATILSQDGFYLKISYLGEGGTSATGGNDVVLYTSPTPEPASLGLLGLGTAGLLARRRRNRAGVRNV